MDSNYISEPVEFRQLEGNAIDFRKTFDLRGHGTDEMLMLYLRKANLPDNVNLISAEQRRTYIYDIIRSNKGPGYWVPRSNEVSSDVFSNPPPAVRPPTRASPSPNTFRRTLVNPDSNNNIQSMSSSSSSNSLQSGKSSHNASPASSFSTNVVVSSKGSKYEIGGPIHFQHVAGDVTRDRTRNAFDLSANSNDNVLKKYMIEHGIAEEDINGMRRQDVIKKIVHSNFTWIPPKQKPKQTPPPLVYATISTNNQITPPESPVPAEPNDPTSAFSNYISLTSRFADISDMPIPEQAGGKQQTNNCTTITVPIAVEVKNKPKIPPPPSAVRATNNHAGALPPNPAPPKTPENVYATIAPQRKVVPMRMAPPPTPPKPNINSSPTLIVSKPKLPTQKQCSPTASVPPPPPPPISITQQPLVGNSNSSVPEPPPLPKTGAGPPPPPPPPPNLTAGAGPTPPPPPLQAATTNTPAKTVVSSGDDRDAFLESIRKGVTLKKVDQKAATISGVKPRPERKPPTMDFLSELKLGITLRRVKNPDDNPYSDNNADESQA